MEKKKEAYKSVRSRMIDLIKEMNENELETFINFYLDKMILYENREAILFVFKNICEGKQKGE